jgi:hypothetical protein
MRLSIRLLASLLIGLGSFIVATGSTQAAIIVSSQTVLSAPGDSGYVQILLENDDNTSRTFSGFSLDISLAGAGVQFTGVDDQTSPAYIFGASGSGTLSFDVFPNSSFIASDFSLDQSGFVTVAPAEMVGLARIAFVVNSTAADGLREITFTIGSTTQFTDDQSEVYADTQFSFLSGGIDVQGDAATVPEPSSVVLLIGISGCSMMMALRRRRRTS